MIRRRLLVGALAPILPALLLVLPGCRTGDGPTGAPGALTAAADGHLGPDRCAPVDDAPTLVNGWRPATAGMGAWGPGGASVRVTVGPEPAVLLLRTVPADAGLAVRWSGGPLPVTPRGAALEVELPRPAQVVGIHLLLQTAEPTTLVGLRQRRGPAPAADPAGRDVTGRATPQSRATWNAHREGGSGSWSIPAGGGLRCLLPSTPPPVAATLHARVPVDADGDLLLQWHDSASGRTEQAVAGAGELLRGVAEPSGDWDLLTVRSAAGAAGLELADLRREVSAPEPPRNLPQPVRDDPERTIGDAAAPRVVVVWVMDALRGRTPERALELGLAEHWQELLDGGFELRRHHSVAPNTLPSTKALMTGRVWRRGGGRPLAPDDGVTLAERFAASGYATALFSNNPWLGPDFGIHRGFSTVYTDPTDLETLNLDARNLVDAFEAWWRRSRPLADDGRVFVVLHVLQPHNPYAPPDDVLRRVPGPEAITVDGSTDTLLALARGRRAPPSDTGTEALRRLYLASFLQADEELRRLRHFLALRLPAEEVLVVATSDHGEEILEHGSALHGYTLYQEMIRIPAILHWPGTIPTGFTSALTDTTDLHNLLSALAVAHRDPVPPGAGHRDPTRLLDLLDGRETDPKTVFAAAASVRPGIFAAISGNRKLIWAPGGEHRWGMGSGHGRDWNREWLFALDRDPLERLNLVAPETVTTGASDPALLRLRSALAIWVADEGTADSGTGDAPEVSDEARRRLRALGYVD